MNEPDAFQIAAQCAGKLKMTGAEAKKANDSHKRRHKGIVETYKCGVCGMWHLGGQKNVRQSRIAK